MIYKAMKKIFLIPFIVLFLVVGTVSAQTEGLPNAGLTPDRPFYFLDKISETLREFITLNKESKARLHVKFAGERIAEIKIILESKGLEAASFAAVQANLEKHTEKAVEIVKKEKSKGNDVSELAAEIVDSFHLQRAEAKEAFKVAKEVFKIKKDILHDELLVAIKAGDVEEQERIRTELVALEVVKDKAEAKKDEVIATLKSEKERLHDELEESKKLEEEARDDAEEAEDEARKAKEAIEEAEEELVDIQDEAAEEGVAFPTDALGDFNSLLNQAKSAFDAGNFEEAEGLAEQAEDALEAVEKTIEELEEEMEDEEKDRDEEEGGEIDENEEE